MRAVVAIVLSGCVVDSDARHSDLRELDVVFTARGSIGGAPDSGAETGEPKDGLLLDVGKVSIHQSGPASWVTVASDVGPVDLATLGGDVRDVIARAAVPEGRYNLVRIEVEAARAVIDGQEVEVEVPPGRLQVQTFFCVGDDGLGELEVDWDFRLHEGDDGRWKVTPSISVGEGPACGKPGKGQ